MAIFEHRAVFQLESGRSLTGFRLEYEVLGTPNSDGSNIIWVCHALTGNSMVEEWWPGLFGENKWFDPSKWCVVCANMLGSCYGSTNACESFPPGSPSFHDFPELTNRDIVRAFDLLRVELGIRRVHTLIGASMGGQQAVEWTIMNPDVFDHAVFIATNAQHSPWGIAFNETQRMAISNDPTWKEKTPHAGLEGMETARAIAMLSYRSYETYLKTQSEKDASWKDDYRASSYQRYQGKKLRKRFHAFSYWALSRAMDSHHIGRNRGAIESVLAKISTRALVIGVTSDLLFPLHEQRFMADHIPNSSFKTIESIYGHDGFLVETEQLVALLSDFYKESHQGIS
ncbi:homoserine O-acetyltransferase [Pontibacter sp. G13]|uniref:homoserine O-acetyltransferase family protein n=1 Tax=Pontibacter sp. G13 TaxID=3074898 RepID=UPI00288BA9E9|nr:homoserine O-acetyltransferase [Pontibacter sp. G13]WNJ18559.1 homoserine O-acetyltransferase [Pontibacter sp. G13]